ncbi:MAG TPA: hypothetical protein VIK86_04635 [Candidatus Paceibacterota bacterium]
MGIYSGITCDKCGSSLHWDYIVTKGTMIRIIRKKGWSVGKTIKCIECKTKDKKKT